MKMHIEYDDFGEYMEVLADGELLVAEDYPSGRTLEMFLFGESETAGL